MHNDRSLLQFLRSPFGARTVLAIVSTGGLLAFVLSPWVKRHLGIIDFDFWFIDSYAVLAASDAVRAGLNPDQRNPLDLFGRPHTYTDWWFSLGDLGLTRDDNFLVGGTWVVAFLVVAWCSLRPRTLPEALWFSAAMLAPPMLLAMNRANNDLVIFTLVGAGVMMLRESSGWRWWVTLALIAVATGLKFYPVVGAFVFLLLRPARRLFIAAAGSAVVLLLVWRDVAPTLGRGLFEVPSTIYTFGGSFLLRDLGLGSRGPLLLAAALVVGTGIALARTGRTTGLAGPAPDFHRRALFATGAVLLVGCFLAGANYGYRLIFSLWLAPWLWDQARNPIAPARRRRTARFVGGLLLGVLWMEGIFCFAVNAGFGPMTLDQLNRVHLSWRLASQPLVWVLIVFLTGWLADAAGAALCSVRAAFRMKSGAVAAATEEPHS